MKIALIGSGGREHALAFKMSQSPLVEEILVMPGNPAIAKEAKCRCLPLPADAAAFCKEQGVDLTVVGPEDPLVAGIANQFRKEGLVIFGPGKDMARLEGSKEFAKEFMNRYGVATAKHQSFHEAQAALEYLENQTFPLVVKASGLCAGKGVIICDSKAEARAAIKALMEDQKFKDAGSTVVIEDFLEGKEVSILALYDGRRITPLISAMDHKRIGEGDTGENTGGMGTVAPAPHYTQAAQADFLENIMTPTLQGLQAEGFLDPACIFFGLMITSQGVKLLEYNLRFGDPETQSVLSLLSSDLVDHFLKACQGNLEPDMVTFHQESAMTWIGASQGYPGPYKKDIPLNLGQAEGIKLFYAGVKEEAGQLLSSGGRIFGATAKGPLQEIRQKLYDYMSKLPEEIYWRQDLGQDL